MDNVICINRPNSETNEVEIKPETEDIDTEPSEPSELIDTDKLIDELADKLETLKITNKQEPTKSEPTQSKPCGHELCKWSFGGAAIVIMSDWVSKTPPTKTMALVGKEQGSNLISGIGGKCDHHDGCIIYAMVCELCEEGKLCFHTDRIAHTGIDYDIVDKVFGTDLNQHFKVGKGRGTCVFYTKVSNLNKTSINKCINLHNKNDTLAADQRELELVDWIQVGHYRSTTNLKISRYWKLLATQLKCRNLTDIPENIHSIDEYIRSDYHKQ